MKLRVGIVAISIALVIAAVAGAESFRDAVGDTEGPDIDAVAIAHSGATLNVDIHLANRPRLEPEEAIQVEIDLDSNANTGDDGIDLHALYVEGEPTEVLLWQNDDYVESNRATITWNAATATAHLQVPLALVTRAVKVEVAALGIGEDAETEEPVAPVDDPVDVAPDEGAFAYTVTTEARRLVKSTLAFAPAQPRAGKAFRLSGASLEFNDVGTVKATTTCSAKLAGKKFGKGCSWKLPKTAKRKALVVTVAAAYGGDRYSFSRRFVVR